MPPRVWPDRVQDILDAIAVAQEATAALTFAQFAADRVRVQAVLYSFAIIGEAILGIPEEIRARYPEIPWRQIRETRNIVVHVYFGVKLELVWETIWTHLPPFREQLVGLLAAEDAEHHGAAPTGHCTDGADQA